MALYTATLTVPPNTAEYNPVSTTIKPGVGYLKRVSVFFANGSNGLVGVKLFDEGRQFAPLPAGWITGNDQEISWDENRQLQGPPYRIVVQGYSRAMDWPHSVRIRLEIVL